MKTIWITALVCACAMAVVNSAAVPTQETLVVARSDDASTTPAPSTAAEPVTSMAPPAPIKLTSMEVTSEVTLRYAQTGIVTRVKNPAKQAQEATFRVLLPETAFISGFVMILDGKSYKAYVKEKDEAKKIYNEAVSAGIGAAHIATKARDSNHFTVSVNVEPNTEAVFNLTYEELLVRRNGVYNHAINLHPGTVVPKMSVQVHIKEAQNITQLWVPEIRTGNEVDATEGDAVNSKAVIARSPDGKEATISFYPDIEEQKRLMEIYALKSKESRESTRKPWLTPSADETGPDGVLGQFVLQYDVHRPKEGEILVNDGYFVHFFAPPSLPPLAKHVVFVLDTSGSMMDRKIVQLKEAMKTILTDLNPADYFSIVEFSYFVKVHDLKEALEEEPPKRHYYYEENEMKPLVLVPPFKASKENIDKAKVIISRLEANGGTNIDEALSVAVNLIRKGINWTAPPTAAPTVPPTGTPTVAEAQPTPVALKASEGSDVTTEVAKQEKVTPKLDEKEDDIDKPEPMIIFLTDGEATLGETNPDRIISRLSERNYGHNKATIFSLAFGEEADRSLLRKLSLRNSGFMRHIYEAADAALQLHDFYKQVASPLLAHVTFSYPSDQVKEGSVTRREFRTYYAGSETIVAGRLEDVEEFTPQVSGFCGVQDGFGKKKYSIFPKVPVAKKGHYLPLERVWAYTTIKQLLDEREIRDKSDDKEKSPEKKALALALKYEFVTPLTSLVVVKPNATKAVDAESVDDKTMGGGPLYNFAPLAASFGSSQGGAGFPAAPGYAFFPAPLGLHGGKRRFLSKAEPGGMNVIYDNLRGLEQHDGNTKHPQKPQGLPGPPPVADFFESEEPTLISEDGLEGLPGPPPVADFFESEEPTLISEDGLEGNRLLSGATSLKTATAFIRPTSSIAVSEDLLNTSNLVALQTSTYTPLPPASTTYPPPPAPQPTITPSPASSPPTASSPSPALTPQQIYHLEKFPWTEGLIDQQIEKLVLPVNGTTVLLKLTTDDINQMAPDETFRNETCARAAGSDAPGVCIYLTKCAAAQNITADQYAELYYCKVKFGLAGVCCSESSIGSGHSSKP